MSAAQLKTIMPGVTLRKGERAKSVRYSYMKDGHRFSKTCDLPTDLLVDDHGKPTRLLKQDFRAWVDKCDLMVETDVRRLREPTIAELVDMYEKIATARFYNPNYHKPNLRSINTAVKNYQYCVEMSGLRPSDPYTKLINRDMMRQLFRKFTEAGKRGVSAWSYVMSLKSVTANWALDLYADNGYTVESTRLPDMGKARLSPNYQELPAKLDAAITNWIEMMKQNAPKEYVFYIVCMDKLAMRPNDIGQLTAANFIIDNGHHRLRYTPAKTRESSGRVVDMEIKDELWQELYELTRTRYDAGELLLPNWTHVSNMVNSSMRICCNMPKSQFTKASYELRKRCLHRVMKNQGLEQSSRLAGDELKTVAKFYTDPYRGQVMLDS